MNSLTLPIALAVLASHAAADGTADRLARSRSLAPTLKLYTVAKSEPIGLLIPIDEATRNAVSGTRDGLYWYLHGVFDGVTKARNLARFYTALRRGKMTIQMPAKGRLKEVPVRRLLTPRQTEKLEDLLWQQYTRLYQLEQHERAKRRRLIQAQTEEMKKRLLDNPRDAKALVWIWRFGSFDDYRWARSVSKVPLSVSNRERKLKAIDHRLRALRLERGLLVARFDKLSFARFKALTREIRRLEKEKHQLQRGLRQTRPTNADER
jgi:hypothetical protein